MIGSNLWAEIEAAGLSGLPFGITPDGDLVLDHELTPEQRSAVLAVVAAHVPVDPAKELVRAQIADLERAQMLPRIVREYLLASVETQFTPEQLAENPGYQRLKAFDEQIAYLRGLL